MREPEPGLHDDTELDLRRYEPSEPVVEVTNRGDVWKLVPRLRKRLGRRRPRGYRRGKRVISETIGKMLRVGPSRAAYLADRMEAVGAIVYERPRKGSRKSWYVRRKKS
jgi:hypothetical protein